MSVTWLIFANIHGYLCITERATGANILVIEGWLPDEVLVAELKNFEPGKPYDFVCTTGSTLSRGSYLSEYETFANLTANTIEKLGVPKELIIVAPSQPHARDRTYQSALAFKRVREASSNATLRNAKSIDVFTEGVHARRTYTVFQKALGDSVQVGIISGASASYDASQWYRSSNGAKNVIMETISLGYELFGVKDR